MFMFREILNNFGQKHVEEIWTTFKSAIHEGISKFVPIKKIRVKKSLPRVTQELNRLIRIVFIKSKKKED